MKEKGEGDSRWQASARETSMPATAWSRCNSSFIQIRNSELRVNISEILNFDTLQARLDAAPSVGTLVLKPS